MDGTKLNVKPIYIGSSHFLNQSLVNNSAFAVKLIPNMLTISYNIILDTF